jgi:hypothetical protein
MLYVFLSIKHFTIIKKLNQIETVGINMKITVGFQVLTAVVTKISILWDVMACSQMKVNRNLLYLLPTSLWFLPWFVLRPWSWRRCFPPNHRLTFNGLHGSNSQKRELFIQIVKTREFSLKIVVKHSHICVHFISILIVHFPVISH